MRIQFNRMTRLFPRVLLGAGEFDFGGAEAYVFVALGACPCKSYSAIRDQGKYYSRPPAPDQVSMEDKPEQEAHSPGPPYSFPTFKLFFPMGVM